MAGLTTDGRVSVFTGADGLTPTMPQLDSDGKLPISQSAPPAGAATSALQSAVQSAPGTPSTTAAVTVQDARKPRIVVCELTRTADAYTYAQTQIWRAAASGHDVFNAPCGLVNGDAIEILRARLIKSTNVTAGFAASVYLHTTAINAADKDVMNLAYTRNANRAAKIDFPYMQIEGAASDCCMSWGFFPQGSDTTEAVCDPADTMLYPRVVIEGPYVATASEKLYLELTIK